jgi:hypothetical protein
MISPDHYSQELNAQFERAASRGMSHILVNARELHASLGDFPGSDDKLTSCRLVMRNEMKTGDVMVVTRENLMGMTVRYLLPRAVH